LPIYEYRCDECGHTFEVVQKFSDAPVETCEVCGGHVSKVLHPVAIHFKGSGFYTTDYGRGPSKGRPGASEAPAKTDGDRAAKGDGDAPATAAKGSGSGAVAKDASSADKGSGSGSGGSGASPGSG